MRPALLLGFFLAGCAHTLNFPGPTAAVGRSPAPPLVPTPAEPIASVPDPTPSVVDVPPARPKPRKNQQTQLARSARHYLRVSPPSSFRADCSGFVCAVYDHAGGELSGNTSSMWALAKSTGRVHHRKIPALGDLVFFDNTYDRNKNRRLDDGLTHIGVVIEVLDDGTILIAHSGTSKGRTTLRLNLKHPSQHLSLDGNVMNDFLRRKKDSDPRGTKYLAGELWRGFATLPL